MKFLISVFSFIVGVVSSGWFLILVLIAAAVFLLVTWCRKSKIGAMGKLEYTRSFSFEGVFAGESFEFTEELRNPTLFPLFSVRMDFYVPAGFVIDGLSCKEYTKVTSVFHIPPFATVTKTHTVRAEKRGHYRMETASVTYRKNEFQFSAPFDIYVYPNRSGVKADVPPDLYHAGNIVSSQKYIEDPFFLSGIRPYRLGDPMRAINFKASVRSFSGGMRALMSNSYDSSRNFNSMVFLDLFDYAGGSTSEVQRELLETGLGYSCYLLFEAVKHGSSFGFASNCALGSDAYVHIPCGAGAAHTKSVLQSFAEVNGYARRDYSMSSLLARCAADLSGATDIYLIAPYVDSKTAQTLRRLESMGRNVSVIALGDRRAYR